VKICIVRHGSAEPGAVNDRSRALTARGLAQADGAGKWLAQQSLHNADVYVSPYLRAQQTAVEIAGHTGLDLVITDHLTPDADILALLATIESRSDDLILVSHLPLVGHLAAYLTDGEVYEQPWSPAEVWILEGDIPGPGCMSVKAVWYPVLEGI